MFVGATMVVGSFAAMAASGAETIRLRANTPAPMAGPIVVAQADAEPKKSIGDRASEFFDQFLNRSDRNSSPGAPAARDADDGSSSGVVDRAQDVLTGARRSYTDEVVPRLKAGGGFAKPDATVERAEGDPRNPTPGGGLSLPSGAAFVDGVRGFVERAMRGYQGEIVPRLSGGVPATAVTDAERRNAEQRERAASTEDATSDDAQSQRAAREAEAQRRQRQQAAERAERERQAEIRRRAREEVERRQATAAAQAERERLAARREAERRAAATARRVEQERQAARAAQAERERLAARREAEERRRAETAEQRAEQERQAARQRAERDLRAAQRDADLARQRAAAEQREREQAARRTAVAQTPTRADRVAQLKRELSGDWSRLRARATSASRTMERVSAETETELRSRVSAFEELQRRRRSEQRSVDDARRQLSRAVGAEARAQARAKSDQAEATLEAVRQAYTRRRQNTNGYSQITTSVRAERRRVQSAVRLAEDAYRRLSGTIASPAAIERENLRLRRGVARAEAAVRRAQQSVSRAPANITDTIEVRTIVRPVQPTVVSRVPDLPTRRVAPPPSVRARTERVATLPAADLPVRRAPTSVRRPVATPSRLPLAETVVAEAPGVANTERPRAQQSAARLSDTRRPVRSRRKTARSGRSRARRIASYRRRAHRRRARARRHARRQRSRWRCRRAGRLVRRGRKYVVRRGDSLWRIARRHYGRGRKYRRIYRANRRKIRNPHLIYPCQRFRVPRRRR